MEAKDYLRKIKVLDNRIENINLEIEAIFNKMAGLKAISYEVKEGISNNRSNQSPQEKYFDIYEKRQNELKKEIEELIKYRKEVLDTISKLNNHNYEGILYRHYFLYEDWDIVADNLKISRSSIFRLHGEALHELNKLIIETK